MTIRNMTIQDLNINTPLGTTPFGNTPVQGAGHSPNNPTNAQISQSNQNNINAGQQLMDAFNALTAHIRQPSMSALLSGIPPSSSTYEPPMEETYQRVSVATDTVTSINQAITNTNARDGRGSARLLGDLRGMNITYAPQLENVGINVQNNAQLTIDPERLAQAAQDGSLDNLFSNPNSGLAGRIQYIAQDAMAGYYNNPLAPVDYQTEGAAGFDFSNVGLQVHMENVLG